MRQLGFANMVFVAAALVASCASYAINPAQAQVAVPRLVEQSRLTIPAVEVNGRRIAELSGLAWDKDEQLLYAISDKGRIFHFRLTLKGDALVAIEPVYAAVLAAPASKGTPGQLFNAEGLTVRNADNGKPNDTTLVVSLEAGDRPGIVRFSPAGAMIEELAVPPPANDRRNYRKEGRGLESIVHHPVYGVMTAPESPLLAQPQTRHALYANGRHWSFARHSSKSRLKAVDMLDNGRLLVLERSRDSRDLLTASLRQIDLAACSKDGVCDAQDMIVLPSGPNNFEGMTALGDGRVLIVSDHRAKDPQRTTFILFASQ